MNKLHTPQSVGSVNYFYHISLNYTIKNATKVPKYHEECLHNDCSKCVETTVKTRMELNRVHTLSLN